jgi:D-alanine-D-alanine ligase
MDKARTKATVEAAGLAVIPGISFAADDKPTVEQVVAKFGEQVVVKPNDQGSSLGLSVISARVGLVTALAGIRQGNWLIEKRIFGHELAVGVLHGRALGVVEVRPKSGVYDYASKYTKGLTEYLAPAPLSPEMTARVQRAAEQAFAACGCRDYARVDFMIGGETELYLLEVNTLPGMKETSLLPMSARCAGLDFAGLVWEMVSPALRRFHAAAPAHRS